MDFESFKDVAQVISTKGHLTLEGVDRMRVLQQGMNKGRYPSDRVSLKKNYFFLAAFYFVRGVN